MSTLKQIFKKSLFAGTVSMTIVSLLVYFNQVGWVANTSVFEKIIYSMEFGFISFVIAVVFVMTILSLLDVFMSKNKS